MDNQINKYLKDLQQTVIAAERNYEIWWTYKEKESRKKYIDTMNLYSFFFETSIHAHFVALVIAVYRLFDTCHSTINIRALIDLVKKHNIIPQPDIKTIETFYQQAEPIWRKVKILRHKVFAHRSNKLSAKEAFKRAQINANELKNLIDTTKSILNKITKILGGSDIPHTEVSGDIVRLLDDLNELRNIR